MMKKTNHITIRLSDEELDHIVKKAKATGVKRSRYIRNLIIDDIESNIIEVDVTL
jgi:predicted DNA binding CopG/RHH family protein